MARNNRTMASLAALVVALSAGAAISPANAEEMSCEPAGDRLFDERRQDFPWRNM